MSDLQPPGIAVHPTVLTHEYCCELQFHTLISLQDVPFDFHLKPGKTRELPFVFVLSNDLGIQYYNGKTQPV